MCFSCFEIKSFLKAIGTFFGEKKKEEETPRHDTELKDSKWLEKGKRRKNDKFKTVFVRSERNLQSESFFIKRNTNKKSDIRCGNKNSYDIKHGTVKQGEIFGEGLFTNSETEFNRRQRKISISLKLFLRNPREGSKRRRN